MLFSKIGFSLIFFIISYFTLVKIMQWSKIKYITVINWLTNYSVLFDLIKDRRWLHFSTHLFINDVTTKEI